MPRLWRSEIFRLADCNKTGFFSSTLHNGRMTEGEITFHLREILSGWTPPRITAATAAELERLQLIEFSDERRMVRLTPEGVRRKLAGRQAPEGSTDGSIRGRKPQHGRKRRFGRSQRKPSR